METVNRIKAAISAAIGVLTALWGWFGWLILGWAALMGLDVATGMAAAARKGQWSSAAAREGVWHKLGSIVAVLTTGVLDLIIGQVLTQSGLELPIKYTVLLCPVVVVWYVVTEAGSIVENAGALGAPIPKWLRKAIAAFTEKLDDAGDKLSTGDKPDNTPPGD